MHEPFSVLRMEQVMQEIFCTSLESIIQSMNKEHFLLFVYQFNFAYTKLCMLW